MKALELRAMGGEELRARLEEAREELFNLRFQHATGQLDNYKRLGQVKREIARLRTVLHELELGIEVPVEETEAQARKRLRRRPRKEVPEEEPEEQLAEPAPEEEEE